MKFRPIRGSLETSMKELREVNTMHDLMIAIIDTNSMITSIFDRNIKIEAYAPWTWPDTRIGWEKTYLVSVDLIGPVGFTNGPLEEIRK